MAASHVSAHPSVRAFLLDAQRALRKGQQCAYGWARHRYCGAARCAGEDISDGQRGRTRARRRYDELIARGEWVRLRAGAGGCRNGGTITTPRRAAAPLRPAADAVAGETRAGFTFERCVRAAAVHHPRASGAGGVTDVVLLDASCRWRGWCGTSRSGSGSSEGRT